MIGKRKNDQYIIEEIKDFHLDHIFDCGQCFRWEKEEDGSYTGIALGKILNISFRPDSDEKNCIEQNLDEDDRRGTLILDSCTEEEFHSLWYDYLDLGRDYGQIKKALREADESGVMREAISKGWGIRILKQDLWETLISFLISQNNNIPRIKKCINDLAEQMGEKAGEYRGKSYYNLPTPEILAEATLKDLAPIKLGYRGKYLIETAKAVKERGEIVQDLASYVGVGPKVESCVDLFGRNNLSAFPVDVWVGRVMNRLYGFQEKDKKGMRAFAKKTFGELGGIAQQYLFYYIRQEELRY